MARKMSAYQLLLAKALRSSEAELRQAIEVYSQVLKDLHGGAKAPAKSRAPRKSKDQPDNKALAAAAAEGADSL